MADITLEDLEKALEESRIVAVYQGILDNSNDKIYKYETLARLRVKDKLISAFFFIELAQKALPKKRIYFDITRTIISQAFETFSKRDDEFSINLSCLDIEDTEITTFIVKKFKEFPEISRRVIFEITEGEGADNFDVLKNFMLEMRKKYHCKFAMDDFGTGYSNFANLIELKYDYIKIDASIVKKVNDSSHSHLVTETIHKLAKLLGSKTIAEFVSSENILKTMKNLEVDFSQGFYIKKPLEELD